MSQPYSIRIFLPAGEPDGLRTIEKSNWSGAGIVIPRALMAESRSRRELDRTGVYILMGPPEESALPRIYVGEGDPIRPRLDQHASKNDFWTLCVAFTSKDNNLNKAHVQFLESRLIALATNAKRCILENGNTPNLPTLSEADAADAEGFLSELLLCCPIVGLHVFTGASPASNQTQVLRIEAKGIRAEGMETADGFVVRAGSEVTPSEVPSCQPYIRELRAALISNRVLTSTKSGYRFTQDYVFNSPSTAAGVVQGRSANGRVDWKTSDGRTLRQVQESAAEMW